MSYQRADGNGRHYVWMGSDGLHIQGLNTFGECMFEHGPVGRDNAKAAVAGLIDFLSGEGISLKIRHGKPVFVRGGQS